MFKLNYLEFPVSAAPRSAAFYRAAFDWDFVEYGPGYAAYEEGACALGLNGSDAGRPSSVLPVIETDDIEAAREKVIAAGGTILREIFAFPGGRRFHFADHDGLEVAVYVNEPAASG